MKGWRDPADAGGPVAGSRQPRVQASKSKGLHPNAGAERAGRQRQAREWDTHSDLRNISVPTLTIGAQFDTTDPKHMAWMAKQLPKGRYLYCPNGSHLANYDDRQTYMTGLVRFIKEVDAGTFK